MFFRDSRIYFIILHPKSKIFTYITCFKDKINRTLMFISNTPIFTAIRRKTISMKVMENQKSSRNQFYLCPPNRRTIIHNSLCSNFTAKVHRYDCSSNYGIEDFWPPKHRYRMQSGQRAVPLKLKRTETISVSSPAPGTQKFGFISW